MFAAFSVNSRRLLVLICFTAAGNGLASDLDSQLDQASTLPIEGSRYTEPPAEPVEDSAVPDIAEHPSRNSENSDSNSNVNSISRDKHSGIVDETPHSGQQTRPDVNTIHRNPNGSGAAVFINLNYVMLSCDQAFQDEQTSYNVLSAHHPAAESTVAPENGSSSEPTNSTSPETVNSVASRNGSIRSMSSIRLSDALRNTTETGELLSMPDADSAVENSHTVEHHFVPFPWHAAPASRNTYQIRYQPLYFEDPNLERCDDRGGILTEFKSMIHFGGRIPLLPYMMASDSPHRCVNALPDCPACQQFGPDAYLPRPTIKAIAVQAAATAGTAFIIP